MLSRCTSRTCTHSLTPLPLKKNPFIFNSMILNGSDIVFLNAHTCQINLYGLSARRLPEDQAECLSSYVMGAHTCQLFLTAQMRVCLSSCSSVCSLSSAVCHFHSEKICAAVPRGTGGRERESWVLINSLGSHHWEVFIIRVQEGACFKGAN